jgi:hypothetical protein
LTRRAGSFLIPAAAQDATQPKGIAMPPAPTPFSRLVATLCSRRGGAVAAVLLLLIVLGCISIGSSSDGDHSASTDGTCRQQGSLKIEGGEEREVFYPVPYVTPPYLELDHTDVCRLVAQHATHFRIHNTDHFQRTVEWKARGVKGKVVHTVTPSVAPEAALPTVPVPAGPPAETSEPPGKAR